MRKLYNYTNIFILVILFFPNSRSALADLESDSDEHSTSVSEASQKLNSPAPLEVKPSKRPESKFNRQDAKNAIKYTIDSIKKNPQLDNLQADTLKNLRYLDINFDEYYGSSKERSSWRSKNI